MSTNIAPWEDIKKAINYVYKKSSRKVKFFSFLILIAFGYMRWLGPEYLLKSVQAMLGGTYSVNDCKKEKEHASYFNGGECTKWIGTENLIFVEKKNNVVKPNITQNFLGGRDIFFNEDVGLNFETSLKFIPQNEAKINLAINYGYLFRLIIGNGDYNQIQMQYNSRYPHENLKTEDWENVEENNQKKWIRPNSRLAVKNPIEVSITSRPKLEQNKIGVKVVITGFLQNSSEKENFNFEYEIKTNKNSNEFKEKIGIGFLDPLKEGIETQLEEFKLAEQ